MQAGTFGSARVSCGFELRTRAGAVQRAPECKLLRQHAHQQEAVAAATNARARSDATPPVCELQWTTASGMMRVNMEQKQYFRESM